jgi:hypothetical protein
MPQISLKCNNCSSNASAYYVFHKKRNFDKFIQRTQLSPLVQEVKVPDHSVSFGQIKFKTAYAIGTCNKHYFVVNAMLERGQNLTKIQQKPEVLADIDDSSDEEDLGLMPQPTNVSIPSKTKPTLTPNITPKKIKQPDEGEMFVIDDI